MKIRLINSIRYIADIFGILNDITGFDFFDKIFYSVDSIADKYDTELQEILRNAIKDVDKDNDQTVEK